MYRKYLFIIISLHEKYLSRDTIPITVNLAVLNLPKYHAMEFLRKEVKK
jgi:hypothetical protein